MSYLKENYLPMNCFEYLNKLEINQIVSNADVLAMLVDSNYIYGFDYTTKQLTTKPVYYIHNDVVHETQCYCYPTVLDGAGTFENPCTSYAVNWDETFYVGSKKFKVVDGNLLFVLDVSAT